MSALSVFTRNALREIVPALTREQEQKIIDLYLKATEGFQKAILNLEKNKCE